jgi:hypothetical protein
MESSQALLSEHVGSNVCYTGYASGKQYRKLRLTIEIKESSLYASYLNTKQVKNPHFFVFQIPSKKTPSILTHNVNFFCVSQTDILRRKVHKRQFSNVDNSRFDFEHVRCSVVSFTPVFTSSSRSLIFRQVHSLFQSKFSSYCCLVIPLPISSIFPFLKVIQ